MTLWLNQNTGGLIEYPLPQLGLTLTTINANFIYVTDLICITDFNAVAETGQQGVEIASL